jgi:hypothetical protein
MRLFAIAVILIAPDDWARRLEPKRRVQTSWGQIQPRLAHLQQAFLFAKLCPGAATTLGAAMKACTELLDIKELRGEKTI